MAMKIMVQGTASSVGKSLIVTALCRIFKQDGYKVVPFKSQNMALNSYITDDGLEMGRAQVAQAEACGLKPDVRMNPILLKPTSDRKSQVILMGKVYKTMSAVEYQKFKPELANFVADVFHSLEKEYDIIVIEGAGSPAEINLREGDIVNMGMAEIADAPVLLVGDIDKGGVFASLAGTMLLLAESEKERVKGVIINKFRGDIEILKPGIVMLEEIIKRPVLGVVPYVNIKIDEEDGATERFYRKTAYRDIEYSSGKDSSGEVIDVAVLHLPHISNFTDFDPLENMEGVNVRYVNEGQPIGKTDLIIIPGTKNTIGDLYALRRNGWEEEIVRHRERGGFVIGICGGYQMLGELIEDPGKVESDMTASRGLGLLNVRTTIKEHKVTAQVKAEICCDCEMYRSLNGINIEGYEIHMGDTRHDEGVRVFARIYRRLSRDVEIYDGAVSDDGRVLGTYIHGIFENSEFTRAFINIIRQQKGLRPIEACWDYKVYKENQYDALADVVRGSLDMGKLYEIMKESLR